MDSMSYPVVSAVTKQYYLKTYHGKTSPNKILLTPICFIRMYIIRVEHRENLMFNCYKSSTVIYFSFHYHQKLANIPTLTAFILILLIT